MKEVSALRVDGAGVGVVEKNGPGAGRFSKGQRVVAVPWPAEVGDGTWQQYVAVDETVRAPLLGRAGAVVHQSRHMGRVIHMTGG